MSDTNRIQMAYVKEVTYGVTPSSALQIMRIAGEALGQDTQTVASSEIRSDRQIPNIIRTGADAKGDFNLELSAAAHDEFLLAALQSAGWSSAVDTVMPSLTVAAGSNQYTITRASGSFITDGYALNQWVRIAGFVNAANNGYGKISALTATVMTIVGNYNTTAGNANGVNETLASGGTINMGAQAVNGTTLSSYSIERKYTDLSNEFAALTGMCVNTLGVTINAGQIITMALGMMGQKEASASATIGNGSYTNAPTNDVVSATNDVFMVLENLGKFDITQLTVNLNNNLRQRTQVASLNPISIGSGTCTVTATLQAYFTSKTIVDKCLNFTTTNLAIIVRDAANNAYLIELPEIKVTNAKRNAPGQNQDVMADLTLSAFRDASEGITIRIVKW